MSEPFLGEIRLMGFNFAPRSWATCDGQILPINQNQALFSLLGTTYGGDGRTTFALPDLRGRLPLHQDNSFSLGQRSGEENHTLIVPEMPAHTHQPQANSAAGTQASPGGNFWARDSVGYRMYAATGTSNLAAGAISNAGGSQPHSNMMPYTVLNFCIALQGIFPSRN